MKFYIPKPVLKEWGKISVFIELFLLQKFTVYIMSYPYFLTTFGLIVLIRTS